METALPDAQAQLVERKRRVEGLIARGGPAPQLDDFLSQIDEALDRFTAGTYGLCDTCHEPIETERLRADPLIRLCLDHLTPSEARALERDLELASRVQATLLPPPQMTAGNWQIAYQYAPLATVSGDYVDVIRPDGGDGSELLFLFGDIAGKGVAASMLMAHLHASMRTLVDLGFPLAQMMARANRVFCESTMSDHYATLVCGRLGSTGGLEILNAGHCPPVLLHDGCATTLEATGLPIGLFCVEDFTSRKATLAPGDTLLLYTDGLTEAFDGDGNQYGTERVIATALAHAGELPGGLVAACIEDLEAFRGAARREDDLTIMAIRRAT
jgi:sigma-B regulation protein RsbU (phosphoserine phosphatase)